MRFCLSLNYDGWILIYLLTVLKYANLKQKIEKNAAPLFLGYTSKDFQLVIRKDWIIQICL